MLLMAPLPTSPGPQAPASSGGTGTRWWQDTDGHGERRGWRSLEGQWKQIAAGCEPAASCLLQSPSQRPGGVCPLLRQDLPQSMVSLAPKKECAAVWV